MNKRVSSQPRQTDTGISPKIPETLHLGPVLDEEQNRETFGSHELAIILSHYQLSVIEQIQELPIGSRRSPKILIRTQEGNYLLKRRGEPSHVFQEELDSCPRLVERLAGAERIDRYRVAKEFSYSTDRAAGC